MSNPLQCVKAYAESAVNYFNVPVKAGESCMNVYEANDRIRELNSILADVQRVINSEIGRKEKAIADAGRVYAKHILKYLRSFTDETMNDIEAAL